MKPRRRVPSQGSRNPKQIINFPPLHFCGECGISETVFSLESSIAGYRKSNLGVRTENSKPLLGTKEAEQDGENTMKKFLLGTVGLVALSLSAPASAADLAARPYTKAPPPMIAAIYDWSGFYIGVNGGWGSARKCWDITALFGVAITPNLAEGCHDATGGTIGGQIGYRWQASNWVFGLEAQGNWADFAGQRVSQQFVFVPGDLSDRSRVGAFGLFTGQIGYAWNNALLYVKGGAAVTDDRYDHRVTATNVVVDSARETRWGAVVGAGLEYGFAPNWSAAIEYDHMFMQDRTLAFTSPGTGVLGLSDRIRQDVDLVTVRVNYRWGGPVVAKY
jgi:outer membrane immunogenic protein